MIQLPTRQVTPVELDKMAEVGDLVFNFLKTGNHSDFKIICKDFVFDVHKVFICSQSTFFKAMCAPGFKVRLSVEAVVLSDPF